ncbi:MAG: LytTR family DNA-binding domain-containing protein [Clostridiales bacterium]|nr:LytTR family DNA-binding domain-containing protein [Clostridiales bacterium]
MTLKIAVCEDDQAQREALCALVSRWAAAREHRAVAAPYPSAEAFLFDYAETRDFDILLLDVEMGAMNGVELARRLRRDKCRAEIIFLTSHTEFIGEGYEVDALHYLIKPVGAEKLFHVLDRAAERAAISPPSIVVNSEGQTIRLYEREIRYIEAFLHECVIVADSGKYRVRERISDLEARLSKQFFRCHRSYIVFLPAIRRIGRSELLLEGGASIPLARGKYDAINRAYIDFYG